MGLGLEEVMVMEFPHGGKKKKKGWRLSGEERKVKRKRAG